MTSPDDRFRERMNDFKPRKVGRVDVPDIGWPPETVSRALADENDGHRLFVQRTREMRRRAGDDVPPG